MNRRLYYLKLETGKGAGASDVHPNAVINGLRTHGWHVTVFEPRIRPKLLEGRNPLVRLWNVLSLQVEVILSLIRRRPDVLYVRNHFAAIPSALAAKRLGIATVQELNGANEVFVVWPQAKWFAPLIWWSTRKQLALADAVIAVTAELGAWVCQEMGVPRDRLHIIGNGADPDLFSPRARSRYTLPMRYYVVFFGALAPWQGLDTALAAVDCDEWPPDVYLVIAGDGPERHRVEKAAQANERIRYLGQIPHSEVPEVVSSSIAALSLKVNLLGHARFSSPLKVFEALSCGVPVIVTDIGEQAEIVRNYGCGITLPTNDPCALAHAVRFLRENPATGVSMGQKGREAVLKFHSWGRVAERTANVLDFVLRSATHTTRSM